MRTVFVCCVLLTITISATCLQKRIHHQQIADRRINKKIIKRDASLLVDTSPIEIDPGYKVHPVIAYRRLSRSRQTPRPKQSPRLHKSTKKYRKPVKPKHSPKKPYKQGSKPKYYRKRVIPKNNYPRPPKYLPHYSSFQNDGFGEPPTDLLSYSKNEYEPRPKPNYRDELVDSYGEPIKSSNIDNYPPVHPSQFNKEPDLRPGYNSWQDYDKPEEDNTYASSKKRPAYDKPEPIDAQDLDDDLKLNNYYYWLQDKPHFNMEQSKFVRMPWKVKSKRTRDEDEILVGGQYAEPPARYVPKFQPSAPMYDNDEDFSPPRSVIDPEVAASAIISPYVNYKHSNMAFSPQNLNDAFSIVEK